MAQISVTNRVDEPPEGGATEDRKATVERLREMLRQQGVGAAVLPAAAVEIAESAAPEPSVSRGNPLEGLTAGSLGAITGPRSSGKTSLALSLVAETTRSGDLAAVVDGSGWLYPPALTRLGADLSRVLFLQATGKKSVWAAEQALRSGAFAVVVLLEPGALDRSALRRLQLATERSRARALVVGRRTLPSSGLVSTRLETEAEVPAHEARLPSEERAPVASLPRQCRTRVSQRGSGAPRTVEHLLDHEGTRSDVPSPPPRRGNRR